MEMRIVPVRDSMVMTRNSDKKGLTAARLNRKLYSKNG